MELYEKYKTLFLKYEINSNLRLAHFMAQIEHESNLKPISENLNYSKEGLLKTFSKYFNSSNVDPYVRNPIKIASKVYANRMGNGNEDSKEGYIYRGRGFIQLTGKSNYSLLSKDTGIDYVNNPDLLLNEADALIASLWFWKKNNINKQADLDNVVAVTKIINGGTNGLEHRKQLLLKYKNKIK